MAFMDLDPVLHSQLRLAVISLLMDSGEAEFMLIRQKTNASSGNLSVQLHKLREASYIEMTRQYKDNYPQTICRITARGKSAFLEYSQAIRSYLKNGLQ